MQSELNTEVTVAQIANLRTDEEKELVVASSNHGSKAKQHWDSVECLQIRKKVYIGVSRCQICAFWLLYNALWAITVNRVKWLHIRTGVSKWDVTHKKWLTVLVVPTKWSQLSRHFFKIRHHVGTRQRQQAVIGLSQHFFGSHSRQLGVCLLEVHTLPLESGLGRIVLNI